MGAMGQYWDVDPVTGDYVVQGGAPKQTDSLSVPAYYRLKIPRTQWLYAPDTQYGSDFYALRKRRTTDDPAFLENLAAKALEPLIDDGRAQSVEATTVALARNGIGIQIDITDAQGTEERVTFTGLGV